MSNRDDYEVLETMPGGKLEGMRYDPPFPFLADVVGKEKGWIVATADFVTANEGTGIVHTAVMYGQDDYELGMALGLPAHHLVDEEGRFTDEVTAWAGVFVKDADPEIIEALRDSGHHRDRQLRSQRRRTAVPFRRHAATHRRDR